MGGRPKDSLFKCPVEFMVKSTKSKSNRPRHKSHYGKFQEQKPSLVMGANGSIDREIQVRKQENKIGFEPSCVSPLS